MDSKTIGYIVAMLNERVNTSRQELLAEAADEYAPPETSVLRAVQAYRRALAARDDFCEWAEAHGPDEEAE